MIGKLLGRKNATAEETLLDRIATLSRANQENPDPAREAALVRLRHEAFALLGDPDANYAEPRTVSPGTSPEDDGLPVVHASDLTANIIRGAILSHGSLIVRGLISTERAQQLTNGIDEAFAARDDAIAGAPTTETAPHYEPFQPKPEYANALALGRGFIEKGSGLWTADSPRMLFDLLDTFERAGLRGTITDYLGERPALSVNKGTLRRATPKVGTEWWHQDGAFLGEHIRSLNIWMSLTDSGVDAPGLELVPKRLDTIVPIGTEGADFHWSIADDVVEQASQGEIAWPHFRAGDALLFDHLCLHRTGTTASMTKTRYATETWFFAPSAYPDPQEQVPLAF